MWRVLGAKPVACGDFFVVPQGDVLEDRRCVVSVVRGELDQE